MFKHKITYVILLFAILVVSCERDDICIDETTPKLIVRFFDADDPTVLKSVSSLTIEVDSLGTYIPFAAVSNDSITIPLRVDVDATNIRLTTNDGTNDLIDDFTLNYERSDVFVSRSCGFKTVYSNLSEEGLTTNWISSLTIDNQNVADETAKHISIFH